MQNKVYEVSNDTLRETLISLKEEDNFNLLLDITATDYLDYPKHDAQRFGVVYILRNNTFKEEVIVKTMVDDNTLTLPTMSDIFYAANWAEREVFDQYGIIFDNHPNLKRVLNHHQFVTVLTTAHDQNHIPKHQDKGRQPKKIQGQRKD